MKLVVPITEPMATVDVNAGAATGSVFVGFPLRWISNPIAEELFSVASGSWMWQMVHSPVITFHRRQ